MTSHPGKSFCLLLFFVVTCWERIFIQWRYRGRKKTACGNGVSTAEGHRGRMFGSVRLQCKRTDSLGRESLRRGLGRSPPHSSRTSAQPQVAKRSKCTGRSVGLHLRAPGAGGGVCFASRGAPTRPECSLLPLLPLSPHSRRAAGGRNKRTPVACLRLVQVLFRPRRCKSVKLWVEKNCLLPRG